MLTPLTKAPIGVSLQIDHIGNTKLANTIASLGLYKGAIISKQDEAAAIKPVKVKGPKGDRVLSGWLAGHIVMHLEDDRRLPLPECRPGDKGHVEGLSGHGEVATSLAELGIREHDLITFVRTMPPMIFTALVEGKEKVQLNEGAASKVLGETSLGMTQFCSVGIGDDFLVKKILAGEHTAKILEQSHIAVGTHLSLTTVSASQVLTLDPHHTQKPLVCTTRDGLRFYLKEKDAEEIWVNSEV